MSMDRNYRLLDTLENIGIAHNHVLTFFDTVDQSYYDTTLTQEQRVEKAISSIDSIISMDFEINEVVPLFGDDLHNYLDVLLMENEVFGSEDSNLGYASGDINNMYTTLYNEGIVDSFNKVTIMKIFDINESYYNQEVSVDSLISGLGTIENDWRNQNYSSGDPQAILVGTVLSISFKSIEWWEDHPDAGHLPFGGHDTISTALPPWAALDIAGGVIEGAHQLIISGGDFGWDTGKGVFLGAAGTSSGAALKLAKWLM